MTNSKIYKVFWRVFFMGNLEKKLAEVQVSLRKISGSVYSAGILNEAQLVYDNAQKAIKCIGNNSRDSDRHVGEFALAAKNLTDNLRLFLQSIYSNQKPSTKTSTETLVNAPKLKSGDTFHEVIRRVHDPSPDSPIMRMRNKKGHGLGHNILSNRTNDGENYFPVVLFSNGEWCEASDWIKGMSEGYLGMAKTIL